MPLNVVNSPMGQFSRFDTEMISMSLTGGGSSGVNNAGNSSTAEVPVFTAHIALPVGVVQIDPGGGTTNAGGTLTSNSGNFNVDSFFDVFTELSTGSEGEPTGLPVLQSNYSSNSNRCSADSKCQVISCSKASS